MMISTSLFSPSSTKFSIFMDLLHTTHFSEWMDNILSLSPSLSAFNAVVTCTTIWGFIKLVRMSRERVRTTTLRGPPGENFVFGVGKMLLETDDPASMYESWAKEYGSAYQIPSALGQSRTILYDPKAIAHFHSKDTWTYLRTPLTKKALETWFGRGLSWADGDSHRRQRKILAPAFSVPAIRNLTSVYYDAAHKTKGAWSTLIGSSGEDGALIDVQDWMNHISLDSIGLACFSHDFAALDGKRASVTRVFDAFNSSSTVSALQVAIGALSQVFPSLLALPTSRTRLSNEMSSAMEDILNVLIARTNKEVNMDGTDSNAERSVVGLLIRGRSAKSEFCLSKEEVRAQMKVILLAGYETTSVSITWALIELSRNPDIQTRLRNELLEYGSDPTYDQLCNTLPYLDAIVHETLRLHVPVRENMRIAGEDDVVPLSEPILTQSGQLTDNIYIAKGTVVTIPFESINVSSLVWGEDAKVFKPSRWFESADGRNAFPAKAREVVGHRHLLTFGDGPRTCIGKTFAIAEFKAVLSVLIKNFVFELRDGPETKIVTGRGFLPRPRLAGEEGSQVLLRVKPYVG